MLVYLLDGGAGPVCVFTQAVVAFYDLNGVSGTEGHTALTVDTLALVADHDLPIRVIGVHAVGALGFADAAAGAPCVVSYHFKFRYDVVKSHQ